MFYYEVEGFPVFSFQQRDGYESISEETAREILETPGKVLLFLTNTGKHKRTSFCVSAPELLYDDPDSVSIIRKSGDTSLNDELPRWINEAIENRKVRYLNTANPNYRKILSLPQKGKWRVNIVGLGDVGSNVLLGLKLLGGEYISEIGIYSTKPNVMERFEMELNQIYSIDKDSALFTGKPIAKTVEKENIMDCDLFIFCASSKIPAIAGGADDFEQRQFAANKEILRKYVNKARNTGFKGIFAIVSDPVEPLCYAAYDMSNRNEAGELDYNGMLPEQVQGFGLGALYARAIYYAEHDGKVNSLRDSVRLYGPSGAGVVVANSVDAFDPILSEELQNKISDASYMVSRLGFKPYIAPAMSSGALSIIARIAGIEHYSSIFLDGAYFGMKNRAHLSGIEIERVSMPDALFERVERAHERLKSVSDSIR